MRIAVTASTGEICTGAIRGREVLAEWLELTKADPLSGSPIYVDFIGVEIATLSFLRESVLGLRGALRARESRFRLIVANANEVVREELSAAASWKGEAIPVCKLENGRASEFAVLGDLDPRLERTLQFIWHQGSATTGELQAQFGDNEGIKQTAWNNRLATLVNAGLLVESPRGKTKVYRPIFEEA